MNYKNLVHQIYQSGAVIFEDHALTNGRSIPVYIDLRQTLASPEIYRLIVDALWNTIHSLNFDYICGLPYGAIPLAAMLSVQHEIPMILMRKERKNHGTKKMLDGKLQTGDTVLLIDDFISSGNTMSDAIQLLTENEIKISDVATLIDSQLGGSERIKSANINVHSVMSLKEFYLILSQTVSLSADEEARITQLLQMISSRD